MHPSLRRQNIFVYEIFLGKIEQGFVLGIKRSLLLLGKVTTTSRRAESPMNVTIRESAAVWIRDWS